MNKDKWKNIGCSVIFWGVIFACIFTCVRNNRAETKRKEFVQDSIAKRKDYVKDSIDSVENTPEYKARMDSLDRAIELILENEEKETIVLVCAGDTEYHFMTQCFDISDLGKIGLMTEYNAKKRGLKECGICIRDFSYDDYIHVDDVLQYILDNYSESDIIDLFGITRDYFDDDPGFDEQDYNERWSP